MWVDFEPMFGRCGPAKVGRETKVRDPLILASFSGETGAAEHSRTSEIGYGIPCWTAAQEPCGAH
jgi:hypothetical protein